MRHRTALLFCALLACDGPATGDDAGGQSCVPDRTCPATMPSVGAACEGTPSCDYTVGDESQWRVECAEGGWRATNTFCPHDGICVPPLAQACSAPVTSGLSGATVEIGPPAGGFRPFEPGESVPLALGAQGGAMIQVRVRVGGVEPPSCVELESALMVGGTPGVPLTQPVALHCGVSQPVLLLLPAACFEAVGRDVTVRAAITGAGATDASLRVRDQPCPRG